MFHPPVLWCFPLPFLLFCTVSPLFIFWIQRENAERVQTSGVAADQLQTLEDEEFFVGVKFYQNTRDTGLNLAMFGKNLGECVCRVC